MIEHQVHSNAFAHLPEYGQSDCGFTHLEMSKYTYRKFESSNYVTFKNRSKEAETILIINVMGCSASDLLQRLKTEKHGQMYWS
jgi:hypothetical protein